MYVIDVPSTWMSAWCNVVRQTTALSFCEISTRRATCGSRLCTIPAAGIVVCENKQEGRSLVLSPCSGLRFFLSCLIRLFLLLLLPLRRSTIQFDLATTTTMLETRLPPSLTWFLRVVALLLCTLSTRTTAWVLPQTPLQQQHQRRRRPTTAFRPRARLYSTASPQDVATTAGIVYDAKKIRNFSIIAHIDHGTCVRACVRVYGIPKGGMPCVCVCVCMRRWWSFSPLFLFLHSSSCLPDRQIYIGRSIAGIDANGCRSRHGRTTPRQHGLGTRTWDYHQTASGTSLVQGQGWRHLVRADAS